MVLYLEKIGMNNEELNDIKNHRVRAKIINKEGNKVVIDFLKCEIFKMRYTHKKTNKPLKKAIKEIIQPLGLTVDVNEYTNKGCFSNRKFAQWVWDNAFEYAQANILKCINEISEIQYTSIEFID